VIFVPKYVSRVVFKGGILGGTRQFWGNPYLNSTTVLFDVTEKKASLKTYDTNRIFVCYCKLQTTILVRSIEVWVFCIVPCTL